MAEPLTLDYLEYHVEEAVFRRGRSYFRSGAVLSCEEGPDGVSGRVQGTEPEPLLVRISFESGEARPECPCPYEWDAWCKHAVALALAYLSGRDGYSGADLSRDLNERILKRSVSGPTPSPTPASPLPRHPAPEVPTPDPTPLGKSPNLDLLSLLRKPDPPTLEPDRASPGEGYRFALESDPQGLRVYLLSPGQNRPLKNLSPHVSRGVLDDPRTASPADERDRIILQFLAQNATVDRLWERGRVEWHLVKYEKIGPLLHLLSLSDAVIRRDTGTVIRFPEDPLRLVLNVDRKDGQTLRVRPFWKGLSEDFPPEALRVYPSYPGLPSWAWTGPAFHRVSREAARLAARFEESPELEVKGDEVPVLALRLAGSPPYGLEVVCSDTVGVRARMGSPHPVLTMEVQKLRIVGSLAFDYEGTQVSAGDRNPFIGPPRLEGEVATWLERDESAERSAAESLVSCGFSHLQDGTWLVEGEAALDFVAGHLTELSRTWQIYGAERLQRLQPKAFSLNVHLGSATGIDWFEMAVDCRAGEETFDLGALARLLAAGRRYVRLNDGTFAAIPQERVERVWRAVADLEATRSEQNRFRLSAFNASTLLDVLEGDEGAMVDDHLRSFVAKLRSFSGLQDIPLPEGVKAELRPYQKEGYRWLHFLREYRLGGILADDMGLGKTLQTLALLLKTKQMEGPSPSLVVAPASVVFNWQEEAARFTPDLTVLPLVGLDRHDRFPLIGQYDVVVTNYALLRRDIDRLKTVTFRYAVLDEAQNIKNPESVTAKASRQLNSTHRLVLTGTPIENRLSELWSIFHFLMPGFLNTYPWFNETYEKPIQTLQDGECKARLRRRIRPFILRRLKQDVEKDLPEKTETTTYCELLPDQRSLYRDVLQTVRREVLDKIDSQGLQKSHISILSALLRLRQVCCHPRLLGLSVPERRLVSGKFDALKDLVAEIASEGHRVLLFSQFVSMLTIVREWLDETQIAYEYLDGRTRDRQARVARFNGDEAVPVFLISLKAGGTGLNLTGADYVIHYDPWWNPAVEDQATDRAYRIGQTRNVFVYRLITRGTVEEKIVELQRRKRDLIDGVLGVDHAVTHSLTREDVEELFRLDG